MSRDRPHDNDPTLETTVPPQRAGDLRPGAVVGSYRVERELGRGAAGVVHAARHARTGALVALKVMPRQGQGASAERFDREVQALARLQHPNVVSIHEAKKAPAFRWYSMDLVEGQRLDEHFKANPGPEAATRLLLQVVRGVEHAHARGLIHRDLKPSNILVTQDGIARVSDFGIAKHVDRATQLTQQGALVGTLHYMS
ncbi:MAG: serine/threonine-protein kinase, partial [Planctomycetota bacterium]